jgi:hypothetical protein
MLTTPKRRQSRDKEISQKINHLAGHFDEYLMRRRRGR